MEECSEVEEYESFEHVDDDDDDDSALRSVCRPASDPKPSTKRDDRTLFTNQCQKIDSGLTGSAFSFLLFFKSLSTLTSLLPLLFPECFRVLSSSSFLVFSFFNMSVVPNNDTTTEQRQPRGVNMVSAMVTVMKQVFFFDNDWPRVKMSPSWETKEPPLH